MENQTKSIVATPFRPSGRIGPATAVVIYLAAELGLDDPEAAEAAWAAYEAYSEQIGMWGQWRAGYSVERDCCYLQIKFV